MREGGECGMLSPHTFWFPGIYLFEAHGPHIVQVVLQSVQKCACARPIQPWTPDEPADVCLRVQVQSGLWTFHAEPICPPLWQPVGGRRCGQRKIRVKFPWQDSPLAQQGPGTSEHVPHGAHLPSAVVAVWKRVEGLCEEGSSR